MKPSTHKKIKKFKRKLETLYYKLMFPLAWIIDKIENYNRKRLQKKATPDYVAKLIAKDIYKKMSKRGITKESVIIAEWVDTESGYHDPWSIIDYYLKYGSKSRKAYYCLNKRVDNDLMELIISKFYDINKYTYVSERIDDELLTYWYVSGYVKTIEFGIEE